MKVHEIVFWGAGVLPQAVKDFVIKAWTIICTYGYSE